MRLAVRVFVTLSKISGEHDAAMDYLLVAHHFAVRIMRDLLREVACPGACMIKPPPQEEAKGGRSGHASQSGRSNATSKSGSGAKSVAAESTTR
eukprot:305534-Prorocentrum_minimum.AAC.1